MTNALRAIYEIGNTSGSNAKKALLKKYADLQDFKDLLRFVYDPYIRTGIGLTKLAKSTIEPDDFNVTPDQVIRYFTAHQTGSASDVYFANTFIHQFEEGTVERAVASQIVTKTLKIGITAKTLNKMYGDDFIPLIGIMRAETYEDVKGKVKGPYIATEKIDGARRLLIKEDGIASMYSRSGIPDDGLVDILKEAEHLPDNCAYDAELTADGDYTNALELRQATSSLANKKGVRTGLTLNIFDMIPLEDYKKGKSTHTALNRKVMLGAMFGDESIECLAPYNYKQMIEEYKIPFEFDQIQAVPIQGIANTEEEIMLLAEPIWRRGFEGIMLNTYNGLYDYTKDRSRDILKVKNVEEHTLKVIGVEIGKPGTENENRLGSLVLDYKGFEVRCGSGLDHSKRDLWWENPSLIVGKSIEIECYGETKNKQNSDLSLNCPIFKRVAGDE